MATNIESAKYAGQEYFRIADDPGRQGMSIRSVSSLCGVSEDKIKAILCQCDAGKGRPELEPIFYGKWRLVENKDIVDMDVIVHILRYFVHRTYNPVAYCELDRHFRSRQGKGSRQIKPEEIRLYKQDCEARDVTERDD